MVVSVFDRTYLESVLQRDLQQKLEILQSSQATIDYTFGDDLKWDAIPLPKVKECRVETGFNLFEERIAALHGRNAPSATDHLPVSHALFVREQQPNGRRMLSVTICFNSFPEFEMHPLLAPRLEDKEIWLPSHGNWCVEHDAQRGTMLLVHELLPSIDGKMKTATSGNPSWNSWASPTHKSMRVYSWETRKKYTVEVLCNNTIVISKRELPKLD
jgi:hypothetical protein